MAKQATASIKIHNILPFFLLRLLVQTVYHMEQPVGGDDIVKCFRSALCVDASLHIGEVAKEVEAVEHESHIAVHNFLGKACIPN